MAIEGACCSCSSFQFPFKDLSLMLSVIIISFDITTVTWINLQIFSPVHRLYFGIFHIFTMLFRVLTFYTLNPHLDNFTLSIRFPASKNSPFSPIFPKYYQFYPQNLTFFLPCFFFSSFIYSPTDCGYISTIE